ncbi:Dos2-interacting transcription regulator of RNA-Pol-II-domain-containing protein [Xylaria arbuscula]|nr:Dos2-interacting transcription regulator of RNA-Pol-II-domain-containing protein [Xylaria arbuscula]
MAPNLKFDELALKYVLADKNEQDRISEQAARAIEESTNKRVTVGQWAASVHQWMQSSGEDDLISRSKALDFLASTLQVLSRRDDTLSADQVKLLATFFYSLFKNDHRAGVAASAKALRQLIVMKHFQPALGVDILQSVCKLGDDFKLQAPTTRLEIYHICSSLLEILAQAYDPEHWQGSANGFILDLLGLCRNERDPENLIVWFAILKTILQDFNPSTDVTSEIFKSFSAYFPISVRPSAIPSAVTTEDLKAALRPCFSAHCRVASLSIPYLIEKLDKVDQTVAVKVDILLTLDTCLVEYEHPKQSVMPHADQIWASLKYEVRHGEVQDIIKATLKVLCSLTKRLDGEHLRSFADGAWRDVKEDISDSRYTAQAGRLLISIVGATPQSFMLLMPRALEHIKKTIMHNTSGIHKRHLLALMSSILKLRLHLVTDSDLNQSKSEGVLLLDDLFGDSLFTDLYLPIWEEHSVSSSPIEYIDILREVMCGLGALVGQVSSGKDPVQRLCSDSTCETIIGLLARPVVIYPLEGLKFFNLAEERVPQDLLDAGEEALRNALPLYPPSFRYLLLRYLRSVQDAYLFETQPDDLCLQIQNVSITLCRIIHSGTISPESCWLNEAALINTFLQGLEWMLSKRTDPKFLVVFIDVIHVTVKHVLTEGSIWDTSPMLTKEEYQDLARRFKNNGAPRLDLNRPGKIEALTVKETGPQRPRRAYCFYVVKQLFRRFTTVSNTVSNTGFDAVALNRDLSGSEPNLIWKQDLVLNQLGQLAASVVRTFSEEEQRALDLDLEAFNLFHSKNGHRLISRWTISPTNDYRTVPLSLGIVQGLWPSAIRTEVLLSALNDLIAALVVIPMPCSEAARAAMDALVCVLSNKFDAVKDSILIEQRIKTQQPLIMKMRDLLNPDQPDDDTDAKIRIFRSILHYLAGDVAHPLMKSNDQNTLLTLVLELGPKDIGMGRLLAQNLGLMVIPREYLSEINHPIRKKLGLGWFYHKYVVPYLSLYFPETEIEEREAVNHAVGTFSILRHLGYQIYASDVALIVRIGIRSLSTFRVGVETESLLAVLYQILETDPSELRGHLATVIQGLISVYERSLADAANSDPNDERTKEGGDTYKLKALRIRARGRSSIATRVYTMKFFQKLTESNYDTHLLLPHSRDLLRPLAVACGDPVREIRRTALKARKAWDGLN